jgi:hypothetical protein
MEDRFMSMMIPKLHFLKIPRELFFGDAVMFDESFFGITPKALEAIDIDFASGKALFLVIDSEMPVTAEHQAIVADEPIGVNDAATPDGLNGPTQDGFSRDIRDHGDLHNSFTFKDSEDRDLVLGTWAIATFGMATEISLIGLHLASQEVFHIRTLSHHRLPDDMYGLQRRGIAQTYLLGDLMGTQLQLEQLQDPQPALAGYPELVDPSSREVPKGVSTSLAAIPSASKDVDFVAATSDAETAVVFPTQSDKEQPCLMFSLFNEFQLG